MRKDPGFLALARALNLVRDRLRTSSDVSSLEGIRTRVETLWPIRPPIGYLIDANFNTDTDQEIPINAPGYFITKILAWDPTGSFSLVAGGVYTLPSKGGTAIVAASQTYAALTGVSKVKVLTLEAICGTDWFVEPKLYLSLTTPQGSAASANVAVFGDPLPA